MMAARSCHRCGQNLAVDAPQGLCPECLYASALEVESELEGEDSTCDSTGLDIVTGKFGHYQLLEKIAQGGMGVVYRARDTRLNRDVALKLIRSGQWAGEDLVRRFETE